MHGAPATRVKASTVAIVISSDPAAGARLGPAVRGVSGGRTGERGTPWVLGLLALTVFGLVAWLTGLTPWLLCLAAVGGLTLVYGQRVTWTLACAGSLTTLLAGYAVVLRVLPATGVGLSASGALILTIVALVPVVALVRSDRVRVPRGRGARVAIVVVAPVIALAVLGPVLDAADWGPRWAMNNDAVWNLVTARQILEDGGVAAGRPNASPLTAGLIAIVAAAGRGSVAAADLLGHDVRRAAGLWLVMIYVGSVLAALVAAHATRRASATSRVVAPVIAAGVASSWYVVGFAVQFGFFNSSLAMIVLLAAWCAWLESRRAPLVAAAVLAAATIALLATWAPLATVSLALAAAVFARALPALARGPWVAWLPWFLTVAAVGTYGLLVTLADLHRDGEALAVDGGIHELPPRHVVFVVAATVLVVLLHALCTRVADHAVGLGVVVVGAAVGVGFLVAQRLSAGVPFWGYYPVKAAWAVCCLLLVILVSCGSAAASPAGGAEEGRTRGWERAESAVAGLAVGAFVGALVLQIPGPGLRQQLPLVNILRGNGLAAGESDARTLFAIAEPGVPTIAAGLVDPGVDRFLNSWLLQLEAEKATDPVRPFAYVLDPDSDAQVCSAIAAWQRPVTVRTSDGARADRLDALCGDLPFTVVSGPAIASKGEPAGPPRTEFSQ